MTDLTRCFGQSKNSNLRHSLKYQVFALTIFNGQV